MLWKDIDFPKGARSKILYGCDCSQCLAGMKNTHSRPILTWKEGPCPVEKGDEIALLTEWGEGRVQIPRVSIIITKVIRTKKGGYQAEYEVDDQRVLFLGPAGSDYTRGTERSIDPDAPVLDPEAYKKFSLEARMRKAEKRKDTPKTRKRRVVHKLGEALSRMDEGEELAVLQRIENVLNPAPEEKSNA